MDAETIDAKTDEFDVSAFAPIADVAADIDFGR